jgi:hypothetical protein
VAGGVIDITNQENFCPKVLLQLVLSFDGCQVVACGNDTAIEDQEVILAGIKYYVLATGADSITDDGDQNIDCHMAGDASFHGMGRNSCLKEGGYGLISRNYSKDAVCA